MAENESRLTEAQETVKTQRRIIASIQKELDVATHRIAGAQHILQARDKRIGELEAELFMLQPVTPQTSSATDVQHSITDPTC